MAGDENDGGLWWVEGAALHCALLCSVSVFLL